MAPGLFLFFFLFLFIVGKHLVGVRGVVEKWQEARLGARDSGLHRLWVLAGDLLAIPADDRIPGKESRRRCGQRSKRGDNGGRCHSPLSHLLRA